MRTYLVGGAVRDTLLGLPVKDRDWVVVGADPEELVRQGFTAVGRDFPVFLHPRTHEQYALARTERKTGPGYRGFAVHAAPDVTLEQDLARRDLTINAIAVDAAQVQADGRFDVSPQHLEDPFQGVRDLQQRVLRHVTDAFREDPVRILRVARFAARFPDFRVAPETRALMQRMVAEGEARALVAERVWAELARGLMESRPTRMVEELVACGAWEAILAEWGAPDAPVFARMCRALDAAAALGEDAAPVPVRFALLCLPIPDARARNTACERLRIPVDCRDLALLHLREAQAVAASEALDAQGLVQLLERSDAQRKPERFGHMLTACACAGLHDLSWPPAQRLRSALSAARAVRTDALASQAASEGLRGPAIGERIQQARIAAVQAALDGPASAREHPDTPR